MKKLLKNQMGSAMGAIIIAMAIMGVASYTIIKQSETNRNVIKSIQVKSEKAAFESRIKAYLMSIANCTSFFGNKNVNLEHQQLSHNGKVLLKVDDLYSGGNLRLDHMETKEIAGSTDQFEFIFKYSKLGSAAIGSASIEKSFTIDAQIENGVIQTCYSDDSGVINEMFEAAMEAICQGSAVTQDFDAATDQPCQIALQDLNINCPQGQAVAGINYDPNTNSTQFSCSPIINQISSNSLTCPYGLKFVDTNGNFDCFTLDEIVDQSPVNISGGTDCQLVTINNKITLNCGTCNEICPQAVNVCSGSTDTSPNGCGGNCNVEGTMDCTNPTIGSCGTSSGTMLEEEPTTNLCASGTPTPVTGTNPWAWTCEGSNGGSDQDCSTLEPYHWVLTDGSCLPDPGNTQFKFPDGTPNPEGNSCVVQGATSYWDNTANTCWHVFTCDGDATPVNGVCNTTLHGQTWPQLLPLMVDQDPVPYYCSQGEMSPLPPLAISNYDIHWQCLGSNGGTNADCATDTPSGVCAPGPFACQAGQVVNPSTSATQHTWRCRGYNTYTNCSKPINTPGVATCGPAHNAACYNTPTTDLCSVGNNIGGVSQSGSTYNWSCVASSSSVNCSCSPQSCFTAGTEISLYDGSKKNIEDITLSDILMGTNGEAVTVQKLMSKKHYGYKYSINGSQYFITGGHPMKSVDGWKAFEPEIARLEVPGIEISKLQIGDILLTENGIEFVASFDKIYNEDQVYNFQVSGQHEYIADGYQVHNKCSPNPCPGPDNCGGFYNYNNCKCSNNETIVCCVSNGSGGWNCQ